MSGKLLGTVTLPHHPRPGMATLPQFVAINKCLQQLRDRMTPPQRNQPKKDTSSHPWKVTANGDNTVTVAAGRILTMKNEQGLGVSDPPTWVRLQQAAKFDGGNVESIAASGYIYAYLPATISAELMFSRDDTTSLEIYRNIPSGSLTVAFSATLPENSGGSTYEFCFVIAEVTYASGVVTVTEQILTHNPTMWHIDMPPEY